MKVLVTGGRDFRDRAYVNRTLDHLHAEKRFTFLINGKAGGADGLAHKWALHRGVQPVEFEALWDFEGNPAGTRRNARMLAFVRPDLCVAFPGGRGTSNMMRIAHEAGVELIDTEDLAINA